MDHTDYERYYQQRRWRVEFEGLAYDGGGIGTWDQYYRTKLGAYWSMYSNVYLRSWGGNAKLYDTRSLSTNPIRSITH